MPIVIYKAKVVILSTPSCHRQVTAFTHRISVHGGSPLGAWISCSSLQATKLPRQEHSTGQRSVLSFGSAKVDDTFSVSQHATSRNTTFHFCSSRRARRWYFSEHHIAHNTHAHIHARTLPCTQSSTLDGCTTMLTAVVPHHRRGIEGQIRRAQ